MNMLKKSVLLTLMSMALCNSVYAENSSGIELSSGTRPIKSKAELNGEGFCFMIGAVLGNELKLGLVFPVVLTLISFKFLHDSIRYQEYLRKELKYYKNIAIPGASYCVFGHEPSESVTFYTADGDEIIKLSKEEWDPCRAHELLDPCASEPKVAT